MQKFLFTAVTASTLLSATGAFAQSGGGFVPPLYGTRAFETHQQPSPNITSAPKGSGQSQLETGSVSGTAASHKTRG